MGVSIDDLVRVELHLEEAAVSLVSMGEQTDYILTLLSGWTILVSTQ